MMDDRRPLLIIEDDESLARALQRSFTRRGYDVALCHNLAGMTALLSGFSPHYAVVDLKLVGESGLECVKALHHYSPEVQIVVLTGFASIATAVESIKLGACYYLAKPSNADDIEAAFDRAEGDPSVTLTDRSTSIKDLEWERIHEMLIATGFNISKAARRLGMHRRTLARKLGKRRIL